MRPSDIDLLIRACSVPEQALPNTACCAIRSGGSERNPRSGCEPGDYLFRMDGKAVLCLAVKVMPDFLAERMQESGAGLEQVDLLVPNQACPLGLAHAACLLAVRDAKIVKIFETHGKQVAASFPTALHEAVMTGRASVC